MRVYQSFGKNISHTPLNTQSYTAKWRTTSVRSKKRQTLTILQHNRVEMNTKERKTLITCMF